MIAITRTPETNKTVPIAVSCEKIRRRWSEQEKAERRERAVAAQKQLFELLSKQLSCEC
jgi:hypothetical protein